MEKDASEISKEDKKVGKRIVRFSINEKTEQK